MNYEAVSVATIGEELVPYKPKFSVNKLSYSEISGSCCRGAVMLRPAAEP